MTTEGEARPTGAAAADSPHPLDLDLEGEVLYDHLTATTLRIGLREARAEGDFMTAAGLRADASAAESMGIITADERRAFERDWLAGAN